MKDDTNTTTAEPSPAPSLDGMRQWTAVLENQLLELGKHGLDAGRWIGIASTSAEQASEKAVSAGGEPGDVWKQADRDSMQVVWHIRLWEGQRRVLNQALRDLQAQLDHASDLYHQHELNLCSSREGEYFDDDGNLVSEDGVPAGVSSEANPTPSGSSGTPVIKHDDHALIQLEMGRITIQQAAASLDVPVTMVEQAQRIRAYGWPELLSAVSSGGMSLNVAEARIEEAIAKGRPATTARPDRSGLLAAVARYQPNTSNDQPQAVS